MLTVQGTDDSHKRIILLLKSTNILVLLCKVHMVLMFTYALLWLSDMTPMPVMRIDYVDFICFTSRKLKEMKVDYLPPVDEEIIVLKSMVVRLESDNNITKNLSLILKDVLVKYVSHPLALAILHPVCRNKCLSSVFD